MNEPSTKIVNATLKQIEAAERDPAHPRSLARAAVKHWRSDAERQGYPITNVHDSKGAKVLDVDSVLGYGDHDCRLGRE
jgi:hypothetical protein